MKCGTRFKERCPYIAKVNNQPRSEIIGAGTTKGEEMTRPYLILKRYSLNNKDSNYDLKNVTSKHCPKCDELLFNEKIKNADYPYVCLWCDENFYNIELAS